MRTHFGLRMKLRIALLLMLTMSQLIQQVNGRRLCGEALNEALDLICVNGFSRRIKRNVLQTVDRSQQPTLGPLELALLRNWRALLHKAQLDENRLPDGDSNGGSGSGGRGLRRHRRRIAHECCKDGCSYEDILEYCA